MRNAFLAPLRFGWSGLFRRRLKHPRPQQLRPRALERGNPLSRRPLESLNPRHLPPVNPFFVSPILKPVERPEKNWGLNPLVGRHGRRRLPRPRRVAKKVSRPPLGQPAAPAPGVRSLRRCLRRNPLAVEVRLPTVALASASDR